MMIDDTAAIELGTPSKHKRRVKKNSYDLLRRDSVDSPTATTTSKCSEIKLKVSQKVDKYRHIWGPVLRVMGIVLSILTLVFWIERAKDGYGSMDNYFDTLTNDIHPSAGSLSMMALTLEESNMGWEYIRRYRERNLAVIIVSAKDPSDNFMNRPNPENTIPGKFIRDVTEMHQFCDSRNLTLGMQCKTCSLQFHQSFGDYMTDCARPKHDLGNLQSGYSSKYVDKGPYEATWKKRTLWYDLFESAETYFSAVEKYGEEEARRRFVSEDGSVTLIILQPRFGYHHRFKKYSKYFLDDLISSSFPEETSPYRAEVSSWPLLSTGAAEGFQNDLASGDFYILPMSFFILAYTVGSVALVVFGTLPISLLYVINWLEYGHEEWDYIFPGFSVSLWIVLVVALSIDYSLFILSRYSEELKKRWVKRYQGHRRRVRSQVSDREEDTELDEEEKMLKEADWFEYALHRDVDENWGMCLLRAFDQLYTDGYASLWKAMSTAGNTVIISGLTLAASFIGMVLVKMAIVKALGMTCVVATLVTVAVSTTVIPALLVLTFPIQPLSRRVEIKLKKCLSVLFQKAKSVLQKGKSFVFPGAAVVGGGGVKNRTFSMIPILVNKSMEENEFDEGVDLPSSSFSSKQQEQNDDSFDFPDDVSETSTTSETKKTTKVSMTWWRKVGQFCRDRPIAVIVGVLIFAIPVIACTGRLKLTIAFNHLLPVDNPSGIGKQRIMDVGLPSSTTKINMIITTPVGYSYASSLFVDDYYSSEELGGWGGSCTCPNGNVYQVADNWDSCGSLACVGGISGDCNHYDGEWTNHGVNCATEEKPNYGLRQVGKECESGDTWLGQFGSLDECAFACANTENCNFFIYGKNGKSGHCYVEHTSSVTCPEGFTKNNYNFYELLNKGCHEDNSLVIAIGQHLGYELEGCADAAAFCHKSIVNTACECTCKDIEVEYPTIEGQCENNDELVKMYTEALGHAVESCNEASNFCSIVEVASACECTCREQIEDGFPCADHNEALAQIASQLGYDDMHSCQYATQFCSMTAVRTVCPNSCGICDGSGDVKCVDNDDLLAKSANSLGFEVSTCQESSYFCSLEDLAFICPETCKRCPNQARNSSNAKYGAVLNNRHFSDVVKAVNAILTMDSYGFVPHDFVGVAWFDGKPVDLDWALNALKANDTIRTKQQSLYRDMFRMHVNGFMPDALNSETLGQGMSLSVVTIRPPFDGYGSKLEPWLLEAREKVKVMQSEADGVSARFASGLAIQVDDKANLLSKAPGIMIATVVVMVFLFSAVAFRSLVLGPRLLLTVALTLGIVFGATAIVFTDVFWLTIVIVSPVCVGFVLDYDVFLLGRVYEYRTDGYSTSDALILGLEHTGSIITTAGIIMVSAFVVLLMSSNPVVVQLGFQLSIAVLVDTFLVRTFFVPALMQVGVEWNWWPKKMPEVTKKIQW